MDVASLAIQIKTGDVQKGVNELNKLTDAGRKTERATASLSDAFDFLGGAIKGVGAGFIAQQLVRVSDEYTKFTAQLRLATDSQEQFNDALSNVRRISTESQSDLSSTAVLFARIANGTRELGISQERVADITETVTLALKVSGATAAESSSAMLQLSQAFASGTLRGEEFNAVNEAAPRLMQALADGLKVPVGALREMAQEGKISGEVMAQVLPQALQRLRDEAESVQTISGAFQVFKNTIMESVGAAAEATTASSSLAGAISSIAKELSDSQIVYKSAITFFQTLLIVGSNVAFVFKGVGVEIGAMAAQVAALGRLDFKGFKAISEAVKEDAARARAELDAFQARVMSLEQVEKKPTEQRPVFDRAKELTKDQIKAAKDAQKERERIEKEFNDERIRMQRERILEENDLRWKQIDDEKREEERLNQERIRMQRQRVIDESDARFKAIEEEEKEQKRLSEEIRKDLTRALARAFESGKDPAAAFAQALASTIFSKVTAALSDAIISGAMKKMGGFGGTDIIPQLFSMGASFFGSSGGFGSGADFGNQDLGLNFEGGGFTGSGSRSGGMDGKGGFMAMLHPNETVIDHTKGGSMGQIVYAPVITIDSRTDRGEVMRLVNQAVQNGNNQLVDRLQRQGRV